MQYKKRDVVILDSITSNNYAQIHYADESTHDAFWVPKESVVEPPVKGVKDHAKHTQ